MQVKWEREHDHGDRDPGPPERRNRKKQETDDGARARRGEHEGDARGSDGEWDGIPGVPRGSWYRGARYHAATRFPSLGSRTSHSFRGPAEGQASVGMKLLSAVLE